MNDIHTHLYWESYDSDREDVIKRAHEAGVAKMIVVGTTIEESVRAVNLTERYPETFASVGVHPNEFRGSEETGWEESLIRLSESEKVIAIGECGLDYSESHGRITEDQKEAQKQAFVKHINIATELRLPLIVHCRASNAISDDAYWHVLKILQVQSVDVPAIILHCYMGSVNVTKEFLKEKNVFFSFTGNITYPVKKELRGGNFDITESVKLVPLEKVFTETDCPFLAPHEYRGKRNEPAYVMLVAQKVADLHVVSLSAVEEKTEENFKKVFSA